MVHLIHTNTVSFEILKKNDLVEITKHRLRVCSKQHLVAQEVMATGEGVATHTKKVQSSKIKTGLAAFPNISVLDALKCLRTVEF